MRARLAFRFLHVISFAGLLTACGGDEEVARSGPTEPDTDISNQNDMGMGSDDAGQDAFVIPDVATPRVATTVETVVMNADMRAGDILSVQCLLQDQNGIEMMTGELPNIIVAPQSNFRAEGEDWMAVRTGEGTVACAFDAFGLVDETPEKVTISPGPAHTVATELDTRSMTAGDTVGATCEVFDDFGNAIPDATPELSVLPQGGGVQLQGLMATITTSGIYEVGCRVDGATVEQSHFVEVVPGAPASLAISPQPNQMVYALGQVVGVAVTVTDMYGNEIPDAAYSVTSTGSPEGFGNGRFRYDTEGTYTLTVTVTEMTANGMTLEQSIQVTINSEGPSINCDAPFDGEMLDVAPNSQITFTGSVADANGVNSVSVNGSAASVQSNGSFTQNLTARYGINFVELVATDSFNEENSRTCAFLVSDNYRSPTSLLDNSVALKLKQAAVDDGSASGAIDSLNDILHRVLNSAGLRNTLHASLLGSNPIKPSSCDSELCPCFGGCCFCVLRSRVDYRDMTIGGPNSSSLDLVAGGLRANALIRNFDVTVFVDSNLGDTEVTADINEAEIDLTFDIGLQNGRPSASVRSVNTVRIGNINLSCPGFFTGLLCNIVEFAFEGTIRNLLEDTLRDYVSNNFNQVLDGLFSGLDISSLGTSFTVPKLDSSGNVTLNFNVGFSSLQALSTRLLFGIGTSFTPSQTTRSTFSRGVANPSGGIFTNPSVSGTTGVAVHVGVLNSALHALWKGGFFDATIDGSTLGGSFPAGAEVTLSTNLPPVLENLSNRDVKLMLGAMQAEIVYPGIFDDGINVTLGATATTRAQIMGDELSFSNINITDLVFSTPDVSLQASTRAVIENFLTSLLQTVIDSSLNSALPALPIPGFEIPASLGAYGLPVGSDLSITNPSLDTTTRHYILDGNFGVR